VVSGPDPQLKSFPALRGLTAFSICKGETRWMQGKFQTTSFLLTFERSFTISPAAVPKPAQIYSLLEVRMPCVPIGDAPRFRTTVKRLAEVEHLTSQAIIHLLNKQRSCIS
jgi:hypothetical protein